MGKMRKLIINADGFGFTHGINRAIRECAAVGTITSTSCVANFPAISETGQFSRDFPEVSIGVHFNLTAGRPVLPPERVPTLVDEGGYFQAKGFSRRLLLGEIATQDIYNELQAQAARLSDMGILISHLDGHQNKHLYPIFFETCLKVAKRFDIRAIRSHRRYLFSTDPGKRNHLLLKYYLTHPKQMVTHLIGRLRTAMAGLKGFKAADRLVTPAYLDASEKYLWSTWQKIFEFLPPGTNEIYCHPGYPDEELARFAGYVQERLIEVEILTSEEMRDWIRQSYVRLISFHQLLGEK
jgi:predicted glycoside hydrolase/deacetylase ChbG (UPF0249 family)